MNYNNPELRDRLAAEYVLGTLTGKARLRFDRLLMEDPSLRKEVWMWESTLSQSMESLTPQQPHESVWKNIQHQLGHGSNKTLKKREQQEQSHFWHQLNLWRFFGLAATTCAVVLALHLSQQQPEQTQELPKAPELVTDDTQPLPSTKADFIALFKNDTDTPLWYITVDVAQQQLKARAVNITAKANHDFELWMLPESGRAPISMGLLPTQPNVSQLTQGSTSDNRSDLTNKQQKQQNMNEQTYSLSDAAIAEITTAKTFAISLEPIGGSPTGGPTGPVLYQASIYKVSS